MRYYIACIISVIVIIIIITVMWIRWSINITDYTTQVAIGLTLLIPMIGWWAIKKEHEEKRREEMENRRKQTEWDYRVSGVHDDDDQDQQS